MASEEDKQRVVQTMLPSSFWFWFSNIENMNEMQNEMNSNLKEVGSFETAEEFWGIYQYIRRPQYLQKGCQFYLFRKAIIPIAQDPKNKDGGQFVIQLEKNHLVNKMWEDLLISFLITKDKFFQINGVMINADETSVEFMIWTQDLNQQDQKEVEKWINQILGRQIDQNIEYRKIQNTEQESVIDEQKILDMLNENDNKIEQNKQDNKISNNHSTNKNDIQHSIENESNDFEDSEDDIQDIKQLMISITKLLSKFQNQKINIDILINFLLIIKSSSDTCKWSFQHGQACISTKITILTQI